MQHGECDRSLGNVDVNSRSEREGYVEKSVIGSYLEKNTWGTRSHAPPHSLEIQKR